MPVPPDTATLAAAADENFLIHSTDALRSLPQAAVRVGPDLALVDSGLPCDTFNVVCRTRLTPDTAPAGITEVNAFFARSGRPFSWWLTPGFSPPSLPGLLEASGFEFAESELAQWMELTELPAPPSPAGLEIVQVQDRDALSAFAAVAADNWTPSDTNVVRFYDLAAERLLSQASAQWLFLGTLDGVPVACAELTFGGGVVGVYNIATRTAFRGRGIGTAMTVVPLTRAREAGHERAVLHASADGARIYQRIGFETYGRVVEFKPKATA